MTVRHFLDIDALDTGTLQELIANARALKDRPGETGLADLPPASVLVLMFDKPSTRTRVSFDVAMRQLGGQTIVMNSGETQLGRGETVADTARVLSRYVDGIMVRTDAHSKVTELAEFASVPVINGLTDRSHPCQIMADIMTFEEARGSIAGSRVAWIGDANNVANSWMQAAVRFGFSLRIACPDDLSPDPVLLDWALKEGGRIDVTQSPDEATQDADAVVTDVWVSMGDTDEVKRKELLRPFQVDQRLMSLADKDAIFMHCLPAHRGDEVTADVIDGPQSVVFDEAENRLHAQKAILAWCFNLM
ncbi:MAG: ornithine carbamoyltransferase [Hyphomicrobiaceae bacterium]|nr:ornithine carbamoyltransferase [Hyphomicrobiaceae bacterium]